MTSPNPAPPTADCESITGATEAVQARARACIERMALDEDDRYLLLGVVFDETKPNPPRGLRAQPPKPKAQSERKPPKIRADCGTPRAYRRHHVNGEDACQQCKDAITALRNEQQAAAEQRKTADSGIEESL